MQSIKWNRRFIHNRRNASLNFNEFDKDLVKMIIDDFVAMDADARIRAISKFEIKERYLLISLCASIIKGGEE
jgi:hypothetical protein